MTYEFERLIDTASSAVRSLQRPEGRKVLVFLAGSWPAYGGNWLYETAGDSLEAQWSPLGSRYWRSLVDATNLVGYTVYTVDVPGRRLGGGRSSCANIEIATIVDAGVESTDRTANFSSIYRVFSSLPTPQWRQGQRSRLPDSRPVL